MSTITANNGEPLLLTWEAVHEKFDNLVKFMAGNYARNNSMDGMTSAEDLYQEGIFKMYECWEKWCLGHNKDLDEFGPIFKVALQRCLQQIVKKKSKTVGSDEILLGIKDESIVDPDEGMDLSEELTNLKQSLTPIAQQLLEEMMNPSERKLFEVWADIARKKMLKSQGKRVNIPKDNTVRMKHIVRAIGITGKQYDNALKEIREKAPMYIQL